MNQLIESYGLGPLAPNTIICGIHKNDDLENLASVLTKAQQKQCNMVILNSQNDLIDSKMPAGDIHIWWDSSHKKNGEFMLILAYMLNRDSQWKKSKICLKMIVSCELQRQQTLLEFKELSRSRRLSLHIEILVSTHPKEDYLKYVSNFSQDASLVFLSLEYPREDSTDAYSSYLGSMTSFSKEMPTVVLVQSSESTPLQNVLI